MPDRPKDPLPRRLARPLVRPLVRPLSALRDLIVSEAGGGLVLLAAAGLALVIANTAAGPGVEAWLEQPAGPLPGASPRAIVNDGLMVVFFLLVGLEIKRELLEGGLRLWSDRALPGLAALGGMMVPAAIYALVNRASPGTLRGWAIPSATDIAFALGVLALLGPRVPVSLKLFLAALAILDDLGAVLIIAVFYTGELHAGLLVLAGLAWLVLLGFNLAGVRRLLPYLVAGLVLWGLVLGSGVHPTVAGVALAAVVPLRGRTAREARTRPTRGTPLERLEHALQAPVAYGIVPLFGFANAGVALAGARVLLDPVPLGVALGLFLGKQAGVFGALWLSVRAGLARRPAGAGWAQVYGVALLCGIGFTMSLFIGLLAFADPARHAEVRAGVLAGSVLSALAGALVLCLAPQEG